MPETDSADGLSVGALREALADVTEHGGAWGQNMHESKDVLIQVGEKFWRLGRVKASFRDGRFVLIVEAGDPDA
jgi:hypothetical protein